MNASQDLAERKKLSEALMRRAELLRLIGEWLQFLPLEDVLKIPDHLDASVPLAEGYYNEDLDRYEYSPDAPAPLSGLTVPRKLVHCTLHYAWPKHRGPDWGANLSVEMQRAVFTTEDFTRVYKPTDIIRCLE
jgi:hypothetical protein